MVRDASPTNGTISGIEKITVYLPSELKARLARTARASGRGQADLIREGVRNVLARNGDPDPVIPLFRSDGRPAAREVDAALEGFGLE